MTLARGLAPAFLRFAGKRTDFLQFQNVKNPAKSRGGPGPDYYLKNYEDGENQASGAGGEWGATGRKEGWIWGGNLRESGRGARKTPGSREAKARHPEGGLLQGGQLWHWGSAGIKTFLWEMWVL